MPSVTDREASEPAIEELVFLARSRHRVTILRALSDGEERTRRELESATGVSQPTLGRILGDFEDREWVSNEHNGAFTLTALGSLLAAEIEDVVTVLDSSRRLASLADALPLEQLGFDLRHLASARVTTPSEADPLAHMRRFDELATNADTVRVSSNVLACGPAKDGPEVHQAFLADVDEVVVTADGLRTGLGDPSLRSWLGDRVDTGDIVLYRYDGSVEFLLGQFDAVVGIVPTDESGLPAGLVETTAPAVQDWCRETFDEYRADATRLTVDAFSE
jgi:hypothetical protein